MDSQLKLTAYLINFTVNNLGISPIITILVYPLSFQIPKYGIFENINSLKELAQMPQWTAENPLQVATGFTFV